MQDLMNEIKDDIYEAAIAPELWQKIAFGVKEFCPGGGVSFMFYDKMISQLPWELSTYEAEKKKSYEAYYTHINSLWPVMQHQECGTVDDTDNFDVPSLIGHTEFYNDFMLPFDVGFLRGGIIASGAETIGACVVSYSHKINREHTRGSEETLQMLLPDMQRSFKLSQKYATRHHSLEHINDRVDQFKDPAFIIRADGKVEYMNSAGLKVLRAGRGLEKSQVGDKLTLSDDSSQRRYFQLLKQTLNRQNGGTIISGFASGILPASTGEIPFLVRGEKGINSLSVIPISTKHANCEGLFKVLAPEYAEKVIVVLQYYQDNMARLKPLFKSHFGLTPKEIEFAFATMEGYSHEEYEAVFGTKVSTTKQHLRRIYKKTGVNEKGKLVALLHRHKRIFDLKDKFE